SVPRSVGGGHDGANAPGCRETPDARRNRAAGGSRCRRVFRTSRESMSQPPRAKRNPEATPRVALETGLRVPGVVLIQGFRFATPLDSEGRPVEVGSPFPFRRRKGGHRVPSNPGALPLAIRPQGGGEIRVWGCTVFSVLTEGEMNPLYLASVPSTSASRPM